MNLKVNKILSKIIFVKDKIQIIQIIQPYFII